MTRRPLVPSPCHEDWGLLTPEERGHFCTVCQTKVWDLSGLTKEEAQAFLRARRGEDLCVSYREGASGEVLHRPSAVVPLGRLVRRLPAAAGLSLALVACSPGGDAPAKDPGPAEAAEEPETEPEEPETEPEKPETEPERGPELEPEPEVEPEPGSKPAPDEVRHVKGKWKPGHGPGDSATEAPRKKGKVEHVDP